MSLPFLIIFLIIFVIVLLSSAVVVVPQGNEYTLERFGKYVRTLKPGLHVVVPFINRIGSKVNMMETVIDVPSQEVITKDNAMVSVDGVVFYQVID